MVELGKALANALRLTKDIVSDSIVQVDRGLNEVEIRLAVTGLSKAGKTVFITSVIQNLLALGGQINSLPKLTNDLYAAGNSRLQSIHILPSGAQLIPWFDFKTKLERLSAADPAWPSPTDDLASISLMLEVARKTTKFRGNLRIKLVILDYPGEWLLDLPLLTMSYREWSQNTLSLMREFPRADSFAEFNQYVSARIAPDAKLEDSTLLAAHRLFKKGLIACREIHGLQYLQPGRFICPGPKGGDLPFLWFFPLDIGNLVPRSGSVAEQLIERFDKYKSYVKADFFDPYFSKFTRQIVLVDVLTALYKGRIIFNDTKRAINDISTALASQKIVKLAVAATKADHVPPFSRPNLVSLVKDLAIGDLFLRKTDNISFHAIASIDSTTPSFASVGGRSLPAVSGYVDGVMRPYYVGEVPPNVPQNDYFDHDAFILPGFSPLKYDPSIGAIKQIGVDDVLSAVIGDRL